MDLDITKNNNKINSGKYISFSMPLANKYINSDSVHTLNDGEYIKKEAYSSKSYIRKKEGFSFKILTCWVINEVRLNITFHSIAKVRVICVFTKKEKKNQLFSKCRNVNSTIVSLTNMVKSNFGWVK